MDEQEHDSGPKRKTEKDVALTSFGLDWIKSKATHDTTTRIPCSEIHNYGFISVPMQS
jgi:hypothetical protein